MKFLLLAYKLYLGVFNALLLLGFLCPRFWPNIVSGPDVTSVLHHLPSTKCTLVQDAESRQSIVLWPCMTWWYCTIVLDLHTPEMCMGSRSASEKSETQSSSCKELSLALYKGSPIASSKEEAWAVDVVHDLLVSRNHLRKELEIRLAND